MGKPISPCKDCEKRRHRCHSMCIEYAAFLYDNEEYKKTVLDKKLNEYAADNIAVSRSDRANKVVKRRK